MGQPPGGQPPGGGWGPPQPPPSRGPNVGLIVLIIVVILAAGGVVGAVVLSGGDDDDGGGGGGGGGGGTASDDPERQAYVDAIAASADTADFPGATEEDMQCIAEATVDVIGVDNLKEELTPEEIESDPNWDLESEPTEEDAQALYDAMSECIDFREMIRTDLEGDPSIPAEAVDCIVEDALTDEMLRDLMVSGILEEDTSETEDAYKQAVSDECGDLVSGG